MFRAGVRFLIPGLTSGINNSFGVSNGRPLSVDVVVAGGGMVGTAAATALAKLACMQNRKIILLEAAPEKEIVLTKEYSNRVSALSPSSVALLSNLGAWNIMSNERVSPVMKMHVWDGCSKAGIVFGDDHQSGEPLSYLVENDITVKALTEVMKGCDNLVVKYGTKVKKYHLPVKEETESNPKDRVVVELANGEVIETSLLVGADGFRSLVRSCIGCDYVGWEYDQMGVVATLDLEMQGEVNTTAWQRFLPTGPVALLPLTNDKSSLVWTLDKAMARDMVQIDDEAFITNLNKALCGKENEISLVNSISEAFGSVLNRIVRTQDLDALQPPLVKGVMNRAAFPLGFGHSTRYIGSRTLLVGDAAHRIHPLAGQGVNLGFGDVACLAEVVENMLVEGGGIGHHEYLRQYETERQRHNLLTMAGVDTLQKLYCTDNIPMVLARSLGIMTTNAMKPVKQLIRQHVG